MKATVQGVLYDTRCAVLIGEYSARGLHADDPRWFEESLYRTPRSQRYFLAGRGGPLSHYGQPRKTRTTRGRCDGERVIPLSDDDAKAWVKAYLDYGMVAQLFGEQAA